MNSVSITGRLGKDPETKIIGSAGLTVSNFSIAINENYKKNGETVKKTVWIDCKCFGKLAEVVQANLVKGSHVAITGKLDQETWENSEGVKQSAIKIFVTRIDFLSKKDQTVETDNETDEPF